MTFAAVTAIARKAGGLDLIEVAIGTRAPWDLVVELLISPRLGPAARCDVRDRVQEALDDTLPLGALVEAREWC